MLEVHQSLLCSNKNLNSLDIDYLAYQLLRKHSKRAVIDMDTETLDKEINKIIGGNGNGFN